MNRLNAKQAKLGRMSEFISTAPLYTKARVHLTKIGNILCTGKGCIGCDRKYQIGEKDLSEILGEVDSVDFNKQEPRFLSSNDVFPRHEARTQGRHGNKSFERNVGAKSKNKKGRFRKRRKCGTGENNARLTDCKSDSTVQERLHASNSLAIHEGKTVSNHHHDGNLKANSKLKLKAHDKNKTVSFAKPLIRQRTFTLKDESNRSEKSKAFVESHEQKSGLSTVDKQSRFHVRSKTHPLINERKTNFLKMLQTSSLGIFDIESMERKKSSRWVEQALKSGAKEEELFPQILNKKQKRSFKKRPENKTADKRGKRTEDGKNTGKTMKMLSKLTPDQHFAHGGRRTVLVIEHSHERLNKTDDSLHKLGFKAQHGPRTKSFPGVSILEIAECVDDLVHLGVVKLIHEYEGRWYILVSSRIIRDFLIQSGVTLRGRNFELIDCNGTV